MDVYKFFNYILILLFGLGGILLLVLSVAFFGTGLQEIAGMNHYYTEKGDCFDRNHNKINEVTCDVKRHCSENWISVLGKCEEGRF